MAKSPKVEATNEVTTEVTVTINETKDVVAQAPMSKATLEEIEAGKKALAKNAK